MATTDMHKGTLDIHQQAAFMNQCWPGFHRRCVGGTLYCRGHIQPLGLSRKYLIDLEYRVGIGTRPAVRVQEPPLIRRSPNQRIPHTFKNGDLCLHVDEDWPQSRPIATTIIPWTAEWLFHYEIWLATGEWMGGGIHPAIPMKDSNEGER